MTTVRRRFADLDAFFRAPTGSEEPYPYQRELASSAMLPARLEIPTGPRKTQAVLSWRPRRADVTLYAMAQAGEIPAFKTRGQWRIKRAELDTWIDAQPRRGDGGGRGK
jgi:excisionase family DNA binding protein